MMHGVNGVGALWFCLGGYGIFDNTPTHQMVDSMKSWGINIVRFSLNEDCALNINGIPNPEYAGSKYLDAIEWLVKLYLSNGIYVILELHWTAPGTQKSTGQMPMPDADHAPDFWVAVATRFKQYSGMVLFDLFNEPYPLNNVFDSAQAWQCWRDGGSQLCQLPYEPVGMQGLINAVRYTANASNTLMLGGISYSNSLTRWVEYMPTDPLQNIVASWHSYAGNICNNLACWTSEILTVTKTVPVITGELGETDCGTSYILPLMNWLYQNDISYLGWVFDTYGNCSAAPALVSNITTGECTETYGCGFKQFMQQHFLKK
jgi:endoglucanase